MLVAGWGAIPPGAISPGTGWATVTPAGPIGPTPALAADEELSPLTAEQVAGRLTHEVYGFLPYWTFDSGTDAYLRYDLLSTIAFFSINYQSSGAIHRTSAGYLDYVSSTAAAVTNKAHAAGVRVDLAITFSDSPDSNGAFLRNQPAMARAIEETVQLVTSRGGDGVNIDLERLYNADIPLYAAFVGAMRNALRAQNPVAQVSVATNGNSSGSLMAAAALRDGADRAFLMGYSYRSGGTSPVGSISPLLAFNTALDLTESLDKYDAAGAPADRVILGLPYYGRTWATNGSGLHASRNTSVGTCSFSPATPTANQIPGIAAGATIQYDGLEHSAWFARYDNANSTWCQTYFDNPTSLTAKYGLAKSRGLAGVGLWALGYDEAQPAYWDALETAFAPPGATFRAVTPARVLDSRGGLGAGVFRSAVPQAFQVAGQGNVPNGAVAVTGNLTAVRPTGAGYVALTPTQVANPVTSTINLPAGEIRANGVTVPLGEDGRLWAHYRGARSADTTHLVFDVTGYFALDDAGGAAYQPVQPVRILDSRSGQNGTAFEMGVPQAFQVTGLAGVPGDAVAVTGNLTAVGPTTAGYVALTTTAVATPSTSTLNLPAGVIRANGVTVPLGEGGRIWAIYRAARSGDRVHLLFDVTGYYRVGSGGTVYHPLEPGRVLDSRTGVGVGVGARFEHGVPQAFALRGRAGVPPSAVAVSGNLTAVSPTAAGYVSVTPSSTAIPTTSTINHPAGDILANGLTVPLGGDGRLWAIHRSTSGQSTHLVFDVTGYFSPAN